MLTEDLRLVPGNRVLLRGVNSPMLCAAWLAVVKAGGIVVATMPMLRTRELQTIVDTAQIGLALCDPELLGDLDAVRSAGSPLQRIVTWGGELEASMRDKVESFEAVATSQDDPCLLAFTSGTTGRPKATIHFHRDVLAMADTFARYLLRPQPDDVFAGTPPLAFTFGLGAELVFPLRFGASTAILRGSKPEQILDGIARFGVTRMFTAPTAYRALLAHIGSGAPRTVRTWISAGEHLPKATSDAWHAATGQRIVDGIGATEMIHIFVSASDANIRPGSTGLPVPGYRVCILDEEYRPVPVHTPGRLAVRGPTGCRYLADPRQTNYVVGGWNITGDTYTMDDQGYLWYQARTDDMIVSAGYNIAGPGDRSGAARASGCRRMRRDRRAGCGSRPDRQGGRRAARAAASRLRDSPKHCRPSSRRASRPTNIRASSSSRATCRGRRENAAVQESLQATYRAAGV